MQCSRASPAHVVVLSTAVVWNAQILGYHVGTMEVAIIYNRSTTRDEELVLGGHSNADWSDGVESQRSITRYLLPMCYEWIAFCIGFKVGAFDQSSNFIGGIDRDTFRSSAWTFPESAPSEIRFP